MKITFRHEGSIVPQGLGIMFVRGRTWGIVITYRNDAVYACPPCGMGRLLMDTEDTLLNFGRDSWPYYPKAEVRFERGWRFRWRAGIRPHVIWHRFPLPVQDIQRPMAARWWTRTFGVPRG